MTNALVMALYHGKCNSLDALCDRLVVDNLVNEVSGNGAPLLDLRVFNMPVLSANEQELAAPRNCVEADRQGQQGENGLAGVGAGGGWLILLFAG